MSLSISERKSPLRSAKSVEQAASDCLDPYLQHFSILPCPESHNAKLLQRWASLEGKKSAAQLWCGLATPGRDRAGPRGAQSLGQLGYSLWALRYQTPSKGTEISSLLQRVLPFDPRRKPSFLMVDGDLVQLNIFLHHAAETSFPPC